MLYPKIDDLLTKTDSKFTLVVAAAKRARQINDYFGSIRRHELPLVNPPQVEAISRKPLTIALEEIAEGKLTYKRVAEGIK